MPRIPFLLPLIVPVLILFATAVHGAPFSGPQPVSPGQPGAISVTADRCPTFSWSAVPGAWGFEIAIVPLAEDGSSDEVDPRFSEPLVRARIPSPASSWTPSLGQCLVPGARYAWFIRETGGPGRSDGVWSKGSAFSVEATALTDEEIIEIIEIIKRLEELRDTRVQPGSDDSVVTTSLFWTTDDIYNFLNSRWSNVTDARLFAAQGRNHADDINTWRLGVGNLAGVKDSAAEVLGLLEEGRAILDGTSGPSSSAVPDAHGAYSGQLSENRPGSQLLTGAGEMLRSFAADELAGLDVFLGAGEPCGSGSPCATFKAELRLVFESAEEVLNTVGGLGGTGSAQQVAGAGLQTQAIELDLVVSLLERLPGQVVYLLYRANQSAGFVQRAASLQDAAEELRLVAPLFSTTSSSAMAGFGRIEASGTDTCSLIQADEDGWRNRAISLIGVGLVSRAIGTILEAYGETKFGGEVSAVVVSGKIESSPAKMVGKVFDGIGLVLTSVGDTVFAALNRCRLFGDHERLRALHFDANDDNKLDLILAGLPDASLVTDVETILAEVGSLSTLSDDTAQTRDDVGVVRTDVGAVKIDVGVVKTDVGTVKTDVGGLKTDVASLGTTITGFDATLGTIQTGVGQTSTAVDSVGTTLGAHDGHLTVVGASLASHDQKLAEHQTSAAAAIAAVDGRTKALQQELQQLETRLDTVRVVTALIDTARIERQLVSCEPLVSLYLPENHGGQLELVVALVRDSIDRADAAGVETKDAEKHYGRAENDRGSDQFVQAFGSLCKAYRALTGGG
ncbi:MAG TPA: hypothetical protein VMS98_05465 [Thermoanaerobaculia bacterium]|nr:hypothetical protein [Thermoanaerobaculia bacterium]